MKRLFLAMAMLSLALAHPTDALAQKNMDKQPAWGPVGYEQANYYFLPDLNIYYDVANTLFYYLSGGNWISSRYLPDKYKSYDLYSLYKVVINDERNPWDNNKDHKKRYKEYQKDRTQTAIRYSSDKKYDKSKENVEPWVDPRRENNPRSNKKR